MYQRLQAAQPWDYPSVVEPYLGATERRSAEEASGCEPGGDAHEVQVIKLLDLEPAAAQSSAQLGSGVPPVMVERLIQRPVQRGERGHEKEKGPAGDERFVGGA
jgi:hypothetical protein